MHHNTPSTDYESPFWTKKQLVAGVDEAGRGPLAGPVVAAAVILPINSSVHLGFNDSKKLTELQRNELVEVIQSLALSIGISFIDTVEIEKLNIRRATLKAMQVAVDSLHESPHHVFIDGNYFEHSSRSYTTVVKGDAKVLSISAASIVAKVTRDKWMCEIADTQYPEYGFAQHKGYGTKQHCEAIKKYGPCPIHRSLFLRKLLGETQVTLF
ncbi:MAG: ribonuclease HII [Ignavibacteria bacterium]|nr:ribonuclease HII [Ignavibacteria bacterium]